MCTDNASYVVQCHEFVSHLATAVQWSICDGWWHNVRNLVSRRSVVNNLNKNEAACEDFMIITVTEVHTLAAAMEMFEMDSLTSTPCTKFLMW